MANPITINLPFGAGGLHLGHNPYEGHQILPDETETQDYPLIMDAINEAMDRIYPPFEPQIVRKMVGWDVKEYFLPALKVFIVDNGVFRSPQRGSEWEDMELTAECLSDPNTMGGWEAGSTHIPPDESCNCGVYGSVNMEEILSWLAELDNYPPRRNMAWNAQHQDFEIVEVRWPQKALCIIEPCPDAKVILCRKGWKASKAFISEIIGETIRPRDASELLSIAWNRHIEVHKLISEAYYESR